MNYRTVHRVALALLLLTVILGLICALLVIRRNGLGFKWSGYPRLSPFEAIRWRANTPEVEVAGEWYCLLGIDGVPIEEIVAKSRALNEDSWQKHFNEDLVELMVRLGHRPGANVDLKVQELSSGRIEVLSKVPMTEQNRQAIWEMGVQNAPATQPSSAP